MWKEIIVNITSYVVNYVVVMNFSTDPKQLTLINYFQFTQ